MCGAAKMSNLRVVAAVDSAERRPIAIELPLNFLGVGWSSRQCPGIACCAIRFFHNNGVQLQ